MYPKIQQGALFIADAHENDKRDGLLRFLRLVEAGEIQTPQLFLMGDMFDLLVGEVEQTVQKHRAYIDLLEQIALHVEVYYFEGNHDFCLQGIFKNVKVIPIAAQPSTFLLPDNSKALLLHGDKYGGLLHSFFTKIIRARALLRFLNFIDARFDNFISQKIQADLLDKKICNKIADFKNLIAQKLHYYPRGEKHYILEGHYHQNKKFSFNNCEYINFASFACNQSYFIVQSSNQIDFVQIKGQQ